MMNEKEIERKIEYHRMMATKMLIKYGGITGDELCKDHTKKADDLQKKLDGL